MSEADGPPRGVLIAAVAVAIAAVVAVLVVAVVRQKTPEQPVAIVAVPAPQAQSPECRTLTAALPDDLGDYHRVAAAEPTPPATAAWQTKDGSEPVILRCGLARPAEFVVGVPLQVVDEVSWFEVRDTQGASSWFAVDRGVYIALTLPDGSGPTPVQVVSEVIAQTLPAKPIDPGKAPA